MSSSASPYFSASYDSTTKIVSSIVAALLIAVSLGIGNAIVAGLTAVVLFLSYAWSPRGYTVAERSIVVHRLIGRVTIPLDAVREARRAAAEDLTGCIRLFGSGGMFGYYGVFRTAKLGRSTWYMTKRANGVVIVAANKTYLLSPDDTDQFLAAIRAVAPVPVTPPPVSFDAMQAPAGSGAAKFIVVAVALVVAAVVSFALLYSPGPPAYTLTANSLTIHDRFYPVTLSPASVDVMGVRVIDLDSDAQWRLVERTNGFANSHYRSGHFRVAGGQEVCLYQARSRRLVLIPPVGAGTPVLLETRDPDAFVAELRHEWSGPLRANPPRG